MLLLLYNGNFLGGSQFYSFDKASSMHIINILSLCLILLFNPLICVKEQQLIQVKPHPLTFKKSIFPSKPPVILYSSDSDLIKEENDVYVTEYLASMLIALHNQKDPDCSVLLGPYKIKISPKGRKTFKCLQCHEILKTKAILRAHVYRHNTEKPFACPKDGCKSVFKTPGDVADHFRKIHGVSITSFKQPSHQEIEQYIEERYFRCLLCPSRFKTAKDLCDHKRRVHHTFTRKPLYNALRKHLKRS